MKKNIIRLSALLGLVIFAFIVYKIGPDQIWTNIKKITWQSFLILNALRLLYWTLRTLNWKVILESYGDNCSLPHLFAARMSSHAVSHLTPTANIGGEAARVLLVNSCRRISLASVIVDKTVEFVSVIFFTIIGVTLAISRIAMPGRFKLIFIGFVVISSLLLIYVISKQRRGFLTWLFLSLSRVKIGVKFYEKHKEKIAETDRHISEFYRDHPGRFLGVFLLYALMILFWTTEIHLTIVFIGAREVSFLDSFIIVALGNLAFVFPFIPASLGVYEATLVGIFAILGHGTDVGLTMVLIRRLLALLWAGVGLLGMMKINPGKKKEQLSG